MVKLVINDLRLNAAWLLPLFILLFFWQFAASYPGKVGLGMTAGFTVGLLMLLTLFLRDTYYKSDLLFWAMPVDRMQFVSAKYITAGILFIGPTVYGLIFWDSLFVLLVGYQPGSFQVDVGYGVGHSIIARAITYWLSLVVIMPMVLRFGTITRIAAWCFLVSIGVPMGVHQFLGISRTAAGQFGIVGWIVIVTCFLLATGWLSCRLSVWLVQRKEG